jgi:hypothetical protein
MLSAEGRTERRLVCLGERLSLMVGAVIEIGASE